MPNHPPSGTVHDIEIFNETSSPTPERYASEMNKGAFNSSGALELVQDDSDATSNRLQAQAIQPIPVPEGYPALNARPTILGHTYLIVVIVYNLV